MLIALDANPGRAACDLAAVVTLRCDPAELADAIASAAAAGNAVAECAGLRTAVVRGLDRSGPTTLRCITLADSLAELDAAATRVPGNGTDAPPHLVQRLR